DAVILEPASRLVAVLELDGGLEGLEGVEVLDLDDGGFGEVTVLQVDAAVDVGLEAHVALLHDALGDAEEAADVAEGAREEEDGLGGAEVGLGDDVQERRAGAVLVHEGVVDGAAAGGLVEQLAGVFLEVGADDADAAWRGGKVGEALRVGGGKLDRAVEAE